MKPLLLPAVIHLNVAEFGVGGDGAVLATTGLGSCVALILWDARARVGAMAHILLPHEGLSRARGRPARYSTTAVPLLIEEMGRLGAVQLSAKIVGGSSMFGKLLTSGGVNMGERNVVATRHALAKAGIVVSAEDVGGNYGRSVYFDVATGAVRVVSIAHGERVL